MNRPVPLHNADAVINSPVNDVASLEYILLGDLRDVLEEPFDEVTQKWLKAVVDALLELLPREFALMDGDGGYLNEVLEQDPNWSRYVERLAGQRRIIHAQLQTLRRQMDLPGDEAPDASQLRNGLKDWITSLTAFHRHERRLVQTAFNLDVGVGD